MGCRVEEREDCKVVTVYFDAGWSVWLVDEDERTRTLLEHVEV